MRKLIFVSLILALVIPAFAVGKVTDDPNKVGAVAEAPAADLNADAKLGQKVTYTAVKKTVSSILEDLTKSTGVAFRAGRNSSDWQVRDRKMNIYVKDVPLNELMNSMARVMKFKWEIGGKPGDLSYRLYMDRRTLLDAEAQRVRAEQKAAEEAAQKRQKGLLQYGQLRNLSDADKAKLKQDNPFMYIVATSGMGGSMSSFFAESPGALEAITSGQQFEVKGSTLSPTAQAGLAGAMQQIVGLEARFNGGKARTTLPADIASNMGAVTVQINRNLDMMKGMPQANMMLGEMDIRYKGGSVGIPMLDPESPMTKLIGKALIQSEDQGRPVDEVMKDLVPEFISAMTKQIKADTSGETIIEHADDPVLHNKITLKDPGRALPDVEKSLADASKFAVVSDFFGGWSLPMGQVPTTESELKDVLDKIGDNYTYNWDKHSNVLELRDRNWFKKRAAQIPEAWLERWRQELTKDGTIDIDELAQMAALTQEQISVNLMADDILRTALGSVYSGREILRLYGALSSDQRSMLLAGGLNLGSLNQDQWAQAQKTIQARGGGTLDFDRKCYIVGVRTQKGKAYDYKFTLYDSSKNELSSWNMNTPTYTPPAPPKNTAPAKPGDQKPGDATKPADASKPAPAPKTDPDQPQPAK